MHKKTGVSKDEERAEDLKPGVGEEEPDAGKRGAEGDEQEKEGDKTGWPV